jgi:hypothetical protein
MQDTLKKNTSSEGSPQGSSIYGLIKSCIYILVHLVIPIYYFLLIDIYGYNASRLVWLEPRDPLRDPQHNPCLSIPC